MTVAFVSHFHWDREWYRTREGFRGRLVDAMDAVLDLAAADEDFRFLLDGQTILLEDYLEVRPGRRGELARLVAAGRLGIGPWYVQPDSLLPSGEAHVRNLLEGRRTAAAMGGSSDVAYVPDSFGHPAQFPQLFSGFGLDGFIYWRGNGDELERLGPRWRWVAPDGSSVRAAHLTEGYFNAARLPPEPAAAVDRLVEVVDKLSEAGESPVLLMNGFDHTRPDAQVARVVEDLSDRLGMPVRRCLLDAVVEELPEDLPEYSGELISGRVANLLPGVWSTRLPLKVRNSVCETLLERWAEPWSAFGSVLGLRDESDALRVAWRSLLANQAHDSICGCSIDAVHDRMSARYDDAQGLAHETLARTLERLAGRNPDRDVPDVDALEVVVFNPSPRARTDLVSISLDAHPALPISLGEPSLHSLVEAGLSEIGFSVDGKPVRVLEADDPARVRWLPDQRVFDVELLVEDVPAFGCRRLRLNRSEPVADVVDQGTSIAADDVTVEARSDGTLSIELAGQRWEGLFGVEDIGDRGDSYDFEPVGEESLQTPASVEIERRIHPSGIEHLEVVRTFEVPSRLEPTRDARTTDVAVFRITVDVTVAPGVSHVSSRVRVENSARDHRTRLTFPTGAPTETFTAGTTFDVVERATSPPDATGWVHPAPRTICQRDFVSANHLGVVAPGLPEVEVTPDGVIHLTVTRAVGWLARYDLPSRPIPAGPAMPAEGAQVLGAYEVDVSLMADPSLTTAAAVHAGLRGVVGGPSPLLAADHPLLEVDDDDVVVSAVKPADDGDGLVLRLLNPTDGIKRVSVHLGFEVAEAVLVGLDESGEGEGSAIAGRGRELTAEIGPRALRTVRLRVDATPGRPA